MIFIDILKKLFKVICIGISFMLGAGIITFAIEEITAKFSLKNNIWVSPLTFFLAVILGYFLARKVDDYISSKLFKKTSIK